jgi:hypothetical protein
MAEKLSARLRSSTTQQPILYGDMLRVDAEDLSWRLGAPSPADPNRRVLNPVQLPPKVFKW